MSKLQTEPGTQNHDSIMHQLWLAQIQNLVVGYHKGHIKEQLTAKYVGAEVKEWEVKNAGNLKNLVDGVAIFFKRNRFSSDH